MFELLISGQQLITAKQTEIDFGSIPVQQAIFTVIDSKCKSTSIIIGNIAYVSPTGKDLDELEMDSIDLKFRPGNGQFTIIATGQDGYIHDKFKINYILG